MQEKIMVTKSSMPSYEEYIEGIKHLWESHWLTNMGYYHNTLEQNLCKYLKVPYISLMVNGHMAIELAIQVMNFPEGSEVITTPFTFISTTHAIVRNHLKPVFCDIKLEDYTIDEEKIENLITEKTVAIVPVHVYGNICNVNKINEIACKYNLKVIYDAAHAFGETYYGKGIGTYGDASTFSFHATKVYNTIEGGAITFSDEKMYEQLYNLKNFGIRNEELIVGVGANAKMNEFCAVMGLCNLKYIDENIVKREKIVKSYIDKLSGNINIILPNYNKSGIRYNFGYFPVLLKKGLRDKVYDNLKKNNIFARKYFYPLTSDAACFKNKYMDLKLDNARRAAKNVLVLPLYPELKEEEVEIICDIITKSLS